MDDTLKNYTGGISATMINAILRGVSILLELGRSVGTAIRRSISGTTCRF